MLKLIAAKWLKIKVQFFFLSKGSSRKSLTAEKGDKNEEIMTLLGIIYNAE